MEIINKAFASIPIHFFFGLQLIIAEYMFVIGLKKRSAFVPRLVFCTIFYLLIVLFHPLMGNRWVRVLCIFVWSLAFLFVVLDNTFKSCIFVAITSYTIQNLAFNLGDLATLLLRLSSADGGVFYLVTAAVFGAVYAACYFVVVRRFTKDGNIIIKNAWFFVLAVASIAVVYLKNVLRSFNIMSDYALLVLFTAIACMLSLAVQSFALEQGRIREKNRIIEQLLSAEKNRMDNLKANMDIINMKCHDMRFHINKYRQGGGDDDKFFSEMEKSINIYDNISSTGNSALDVILSDRLLFCNANNIKVSYIVDSETLENIDVSDIYSLFGNALDNAIKSVKGEEEDKRIISVNVKKKDDCGQIVVTNYCRSAPKIEGGLPVTNEDKNYHGFGVQSMKYIVEKYGGNIIFDYADEMFTMSVLFPNLKRISQK